MWSSARPQNAHGRSALRPPILEDAMALPRVVAVASGSPADRAGVLPGDELVALDGQLPRDIIEYQLLADQESLALEVNRGGIDSPPRGDGADRQVLLEPELEQFHAPYCLRTAFGRSLPLQLGRFRHDRLSPGPVEQTGLALLVRVDLIW